MVFEQKTCLRTLHCVEQSCVARNEVDQLAGSMMLSLSSGERRVGAFGAGLAVGAWQIASDVGPCRSPHLGRMDLTSLRGGLLISVMVEVPTMGQYHESASEGRWEDLHPNVMLSGGTNKELMCA